ncbi:hypothetical protein Rhopal_000803-T1 [Rhodotorula paludigena]|uniref:ATP synthase F0 subunit 8 n=1 Tax=Rhodotorula paludigena TaxID=86838 RepID=A0AAV5GGX1_9BASI|nr:hypothetical protein Rhopal_000803-T1 [Rhodotorula paludigena]
MESSLWWLIVFLCLFLASWLVYLILSTCLGPPLLSFLRARLATHYRASKRSEWDAGAGSGYRAVGRRTGFMEGRGGQEGWEMATFGAEDDEGIEG